MVSIRPQRTENNAVRRMMPEFTLSCEENSEKVSAELNSAWAFVRRLHIFLEVMKKFNVFIFPLV